MKQYFVRTNFGLEPVVEMHWCQYTGHLQQVATSTVYDREKPFHKCYYDVEKFGQDHIIDKNGEIGLVHLSNKKFKAKLVL